MEFKYKEIYKYPIHACLNLTDSCNLACKYCFVQQKPHFMTLDIAKKGIDWLIHNLEERQKLGDRTDKINVTFFGGEPTLLYEEIIVPLVIYTEQKYPNKSKFCITTNGTLLNKERIDFFVQHNFSLLLSIDGDKITQDFNRPQKNGEGSFDLIEKNIPYLLEKIPNITFRSTLYQPTIKYLFENYLYAKKMGFKRIFLCPNAREEWLNENIEELKVQLDKIFIDRIITFSLGKLPLGSSIIDKTYQRIFEHDAQVYTKIFNELNPNRDVDRCGLGTASISISYEGLLFGCQEQDSRDTNDYFYIGDIFNGVDIKRHTNLLQDYSKSIQIESEDKKLCKNCLLRNTCINNVCPSTSHDLFNEIFIRPKIDCIYYEYIMKKCIEEMKILVETNNELFKKYLDNLFKREE